MKKKQLHEALAVLLTKLSSARDNPLLESDNPWVAMMMKSMCADSTIKKGMTDEAIDGMIDSMLGVE